MKNKQQDILQWAVETFGPIASDPQERVKRFAEESIELCQACGLSMPDLSKLIVHVYVKDKGNINQEIGQAALSLSLLAEVHGFDADVEMSIEFDRVRSFDKEYWQARQNRKAELMLGGYCDN